MNDAIKTNRTAPKLTEAQRRALQHAADDKSICGIGLIRIPRRATGRILADRGLIEWADITRLAYITEAGRNLLRGES